MEREIKREIKFRAWDKVAKRWIGKLSYEYLCVCGDVVVLVVYGPDRKGGYSPTSVRQLTHPEVDILDIVQYTGLKDKNGKEIWEGDVFEVTDGDEWVVGQDIAKMDGYTLSAHPDTIGEIIGNIYENPELIEA